MSEYYVAAITLVTLLGFAAYSRRLEMSAVTIPMLFSGLGMVLFYSGFSPVSGESGQKVLHGFAEATLVIVLFTDAAMVRFDRLRGNAAIPARMLIIGMPLALVLGTGLAAWVSPQASIGLAILTTAMLIPTDAALSQAVVNNEQVPNRLRQSISVESGLNDGLALPIVIAAALFAAGNSDASGKVVDSLIKHGAVEIVLGPLAGAAIGWLAARVLNKAVADHTATLPFQGIYFLATAFLCFVAAELVGGNGLIAAFVGGLVFGNTLTCSHDFISEFVEGEGRLFIIATFFIFGSVMAPEGIEHASWKTVVLAIGFLTVVRMVPIAVALLGTETNWKERAFLGWFGPRGLASILFALLVLEDHDIPGSQEAVACVVLTVLFSIVLHGASANRLGMSMARDRSED